MWWACRFAAETGKDPATTKSDMGAPSDDITEHTAENTGGTATPASPICASSVFMWRVT